MTRFGIGVKDLAWLDHRLTLITSITAPSLRAQYDQNFYWAVFTDPDLPAGVQRALEETLAPFDGRAFLRPGDRFGSGSGLALAQELDAVGLDEHILTGRIDDDDAWSRHVVRQVRERADQWIRERRETSGLGITFEYGLEWLMYDMVDVDVLQKKGHRVYRRASIRPYTLPFLATSVFILSKLSSKVTTLSASHSRMSAWLEERGYDLNVVATERPMWLYCRHKQAGSGLQKSKNDDIEMTVADLAMEFGLDEARTTRYLTNAGKYGYGAKRILKQRGDLERELIAVRRQVRDPAVSESEKTQLRLREAELNVEIAQVGENVVDELDDLTGDLAG
jgi:hypothetical protein